MRHSLHLAWLVTILAAIPLQAAQERAVSSGHFVIVVADVTGARVANATVRLTRGRSVRNGVTAADGTLRLEDLEPGDWTLTVTREGFDQWSRRVMVSPGAVEVPGTVTAGGLSGTVGGGGGGRGGPGGIRRNPPPTGRTRLRNPVA